jgi:hypothetical protein
MSDEKKSKGRGRRAKEGQRPGKAVSVQICSWRSVWGFAGQVDRCATFEGTRFLQAQPHSSPQPLDLLLLVVLGNRQARVDQRSKRASEIDLEM